MRFVCEGIVWTSDVRVEFIEERDVFDEDLMHLRREIRRRECRRVFRVFGGGILTVSGDGRKRRWIQL